MIIKPLIQTGNSRAIVLDKATLQAAGLGEDALFAITINPNGGVTIQSVEPSHADFKKAVMQQVIKEQSVVLKRLDAK